MKALHELNNAEKGKLLADLFPEQIPDILEAIEVLNIKLKEQEQEIRANWDNPFFTAGSWFRLADECLGIVRRYKNKKLMNSRVFAEQLFCGYLSLLTMDCIVKFAHNCEGRPKFKLAVELLFHT